MKTARSGDRVVKGNSKMTVTTKLLATVAATAVTVLVLLDLANKTRERWGNEAMLPRRVDALDTRLTAVEGSVAKLITSFDVHATLTAGRLADIVVAVKESNSRLVGLQDFVTTTQGKFAELNAKVINTNVRLDDVLKEENK